MVAVNHYNSLPLLTMIARMADLFCWTLELFSNSMVSGWQSVKVLVNHQTSKQILWTSMNKYYEPGFPKQILWTNLDLSTTLGIGNHSPLPALGQLSGFQEPDWFEVSIRLGGGSVHGFTGGLVVSPTSKNMRKSTNHPPKTSRKTKHV